MSKEDIKLNDVMAILAFMIFLVLAFILFLTKKTTIGEYNLFIRDQLKSIPASSLVHSKILRRQDSLLEQSKEYGLLYIEKIDNMIGSRRYLKSISDNSEIELAVSKDSYIGPLNLSQKKIELQIEYSEISFLSFTVVKSPWTERIVIPPDAWPKPNYTIRFPILRKFYDETTPSEVIKYADVTLRLERFDPEYSSSENKTEKGATKLEFIPKENNKSEYIYYAGSVSAKAGNATDYLKIIPKFHNVALLVRGDAGVLLENQLRCSLLKTHQAIGAYYSTIYTELYAASAVDDGLVCRISDFSNKNPLKYEIWVASSNGDAVKELTKLVLVDLDQKNNSTAYLYREKNMSSLVKWIADAFVVTISPDDFDEDVSSDLLVAVKEAQSKKVEE